MTPMIEITTLKMMSLEFIKSSIPDKNHLRQFSTRKNTQNTQEPVLKLCQKCYDVGMSLEYYENFLCPYCGETNQLLVDVSGGSHQELVVDCEVCCAPIVVRLQIRGEDVIAIDVQRENG